MHDSPRLRGGFILSVPRFSPFSRSCLGSATPCENEQRICCGTQAESSDARLGLATAISHSSSATHSSYLPLCATMPPQYREFVTFGPLPMANMDENACAERVGCLQLWTYRMPPWTCVISRTASALRQNIAPKAHRHGLTSAYYPPPIACRLSPVALSRVAPSA